MSSIPSPSPRGKANGGIFSQKTLLIVVGPKRVPFHIHPIQLSSTAFFEVHGDPKTTVMTRDGGSSEATLSRHATPASEVKEEPGSRSPTLGPRSENDTEPHYHLIGQAYTAEAFEMIVKWLYNQPPSVPQTREECKIALRAYLLALRYQICGLQDHMIDNFRKYHQQYNVMFKDLQWLINRLGNSVNCYNVPLIRYLAHQIAYEINADGYARFLDSNDDFFVFLTNGDQPIRALVFESIAEIGRDIPLDPASGPNRWTVAACSGAAQQPPQQRETIALD
ncbi:hypothetical protein LTR84_008191 [Exophiala bonariae]|uniref:BTB domain-containing protein n=1 Tax=Exophiala bonariae TaxID=1690606 RepID=A0AAV9MXF6_9EURO|nr:hypothetical protein LTR84_008191 [Exophiala bonariae]